MRNRAFPYDGNEIEVPLEMPGSCIDIRYHQASGTSARAAD